MRRGSEIPAQNLARCSQAPWKRGSKTCFVLSLLAYLSLPIPCDAYLICAPPQVGDSWTYLRWTESQGSIPYIETTRDTVTVSVVGTEQVGHREYYRLNNGDLYRASADGAIWQYDAKYGEYIVCDLWRLEVDQEGLVGYEGVFLADHAYLAREGPFEAVVGDSLYSGVFRFYFQLSEGGGELYAHPQVGLLRLSYGDPISQRAETLDLIRFSRQPDVTEVPLSVIREVTWGTVKKRYMSEGLR